MANKKVSIWLHCKTTKGWRYCRPVYGKNNKIKPGYALVDGAEQHFPEAQYCLYYQETSGKRVWEKVTKNAVLAIEMAERRQAYMQAKAAGVPVQDNTEIPVMFSYTLAPYLEEYKLTNRIESYNLMRQTLSEFRDFVRKNIINQITRLDLLRYKQFLLYVELPAEIAVTGELLAEARKRFRAMAPFMEFLNAPLERAAKVPKMLA